MSSINSKRIIDDLLHGHMAEDKRRGLMDWYERTFRKRSTSVGLCKADPDPVKTREVPPVQSGVPS